MAKKRYFTGKGPRKAPVSPLGPKGPTFYDIRVGDHVQHQRSKRTGVVLSTAGVHSEIKVRWDEPVFGKVIEGWVAHHQLEPVE